MRKGILLGLIALSSLASLPALAVDNGIYLGGSVGASKVTNHDFGVSTDSTGFKVIAGWRFIDWLSIEGNYIDFGPGNDTAGGQKIRTDGNGVSLSAVGFLPLGPFDLFARVGAFDWSASASSSSIGNFGKNGTDVTYGGGAQFRLLGFSFRAEYERFDLSGSDVDLFTVGATWTFF
jgi:Outer membrane protein beta-barrel domain